MLKLISLVSLSLAVNSCGGKTIKIEDARLCAVAGSLSAGGICSHLLNDQTEDLTFDQYLDFLEARNERPDPVHAGQKLQAHGAAISLSAADFGTLKTELETACRELGDHCSVAFQTLLHRLSKYSTISHN